MTWPPRAVWIALAVAFIAALVFVPAITGGWIYDDHLLIADNHYVHSLSWWPRWFVTDFWDLGDEFTRLSGRIAYWRPVITATYGMDWAVSGGAPLWFHIVNFAWHAVVGALTFLVLRRWLTSLWPAVLASLLFVVHPTKAESVAWIAGRTDVICVAAMLFASQGIARRLAGKRGGVLMECAGTLLAYTTKEQAIVLPAFVAIEAWVAAGRPALDVRVALRLAKVAAPQIVIAAVYLVIRKVVLPIEAMNVEHTHQPALEHLQAVLETFGRFASLSFTPHDLSIQHGLVHVEGGRQLHDTVYVALGAATILSLLAAAFLARKRLPAVTLGIVFFLFTVAPTSNIVNTQMMTLVSERFLYLPLLGLAFAVGALLERWPSHAAYAVAGVAVAVLAVQALRRSHDYGDEDAFWARELAMHPDSSEARRGRIRLEIRQRRYKAAVVDWLQMTRIASQNEDLPAAAEVAQLLSDLTPDHDRAQLEAIDTFVADLLARKSPTANLTLPALTFTVPTGTRSFKLHMEGYELTLMSLRAGIRSRLGDDAGAVELGAAALASCQTCPTAIKTAGLALARAGRYDEATPLLDAGRDQVSDKALGGIRTMVDKSRVEWDRAATTTGPAQLQARAAALAALELWGRAYDVLAPYKDQIKAAPKFALGFAELAFRAGEPATAHEVLEGTKSPAEIERLVHDWSRTMGWVDE